jgi:hypothetical protein
MLRHSQFDLDELLLKHVRHKSKAIAPYSLPPYLVTLLRADDEVWRTAEG